MRKIKTNNSQETQELAQRIAKTLKGGEVICLEGDLGGGKTTFTQGLLKELGAEGPYTSPTFVVMKKYDLEDGQVSCVYHIDAYRVDANGVLDLGWEEIAGNKKNIVIVEWPERLSGILPEDSFWVTFSWIDENEREVLIDERFEV
ncbi:MAG: tRNA (adenosine(37)-N6)-threonylcarbamoyltransferase complex ATPase subunit type 1 TsaE [Candidatus Moranbacteria bacterium]|nr:tRNA (adenosine(37)-N6)-threonylcarbamoyltransferase complex ATPase subunit type 1 TsaE [Candidatus Moranbacteria bacterium]